MTDSIASLIRFGTIAEVDLEQARCRVAYGDPDSDDGEAQTGWIRWLAPRAGETRVWCAPSVDEQVILLCPDGQIGAAVAIPGIWRDTFPPPDQGPATLIEWADGARIAYDPEASELRADLPSGAIVHIVSPGGVTIDAEDGVSIIGNLTIDGDVSVAGTIEAEGDVTGEGVSLAHHRHSGVQSGGAQTGEPA